MMTLGLTHYLVLSAVLFTIACHYLTVSTKNVRSTTIPMIMAKA